MKNIVSTIILTACAGVMFSGCAKPDAVTPKDQKELADIYGTKEGSGRDRLFEARYSTNKDTIYFDIPYYYPANSDNETDLTKVILRGTIPTDAVIAPSLGTYMDLSKPFNLTVTSGTGGKQQYVVVGKKVGDYGLSKATLSFTADGIAQTIEGVIQPNNEVLFYVVPGTNISGAVFSYEINTHSTGSITQNAALDLTAGSKPFVVTGVDGVSRTYTLKALEPVKLDYGVGISRKLFSKTPSEMNFTANMEVSIAVSGDYLVLVRRTSPGKYSVYNRFTGAYVQDMTYPFGAQLSFQMVEDSQGALLAASWAPKNAKFILYKYNTPFDTNPVKLVDWTNNNPNGLTTDGGVGRRVNIYGDLTKDAVIMATAGQSTTIYRWRVANGVLVNNNPDVLTYQSLVGGAATAMGYYAEAQPISTGANADYFINYQFEIGLVNGATQTRTIGFANDTKVFGIFHMPTAYVTFNNANYLAIVKYVDTYDLNIVNMCLFDVTKTSLISTLPTSEVYPSFNVFTSETFRGTANANGTADIAVGFSNNKERMQVYTLLTNGGVMAHEFTNYAK